MMIYLIIIVVIYLTHSILLVLKFKRKCSEIYLEGYHKAIDDVHKAFKKRGEK